MQAAAPVSLTGSECSSALLSELFAAADILVGTRWQWPARTGRVGGRWGGGGGTTPAVLPPAWAPATASSTHNPEWN